VRAVHEPGFAAVMVVRADGRWMLRDTGQAMAELGPYALRHHWFDIRGAPELLFLRGDKDKWVVAADAHEGSVRPLFPLEWDPSRDAYLFGGCGVHLDDGSGPALVHTGAVHHDYGLMPGNVFVVRRAYPGGELQWVFTADHLATALDADDEFVYVAFNSGVLVVLRAADGAVHARHELGAVPLALVRLGPGRVAVGTLDGRVFVCSLRVRVAGA
jgi:hypothetical protein